MASVSRCSPHQPPSTQNTTHPLTSSFFKTLTDQVITVELKNDLCITGTLKSVDQ